MIKDINYSEMTKEEIFEEILDAIYDDGVLYVDLLETLDDEMDGALLGGYKWQDMEDFETYFESESHTRLFEIADSDFNIHDNYFRLRKSKYEEVLESSYYKEYPHFENEWTVKFIINNYERIADSWNDIELGKMIAAYKEKKNAQ